MAFEIERKFLVTDISWKSGTKAKKSIRQGFLSNDPSRTVRVRIVDDEAVLTIKGAAKGAVRVELEYPVPIREAELMLRELCLSPMVVKNRYIVGFRDKIWEVDEFLGENEGLVIAEVELDSEDEPLILPDWAGAEVTDDPRYYNVNLVLNPFNRWKKFP